MAAFSAGQRVKRLGGCEDAFYPCAPAGLEGVIIEIGRKIPETGVQLWRVNFGAFQWSCVEHSLAPLTDPKADEFIERIKKLKPYDEPKANPRFVEQVIVFAPNVK